MEDKKEVMEFDMAFEPFQNIIEEAEFRNLKKSFITDISEKLGGVPPYCHPDLEVAIHLLTYEESNINERGIITFPNVALRERGFRYALPNFDCSPNKFIIGGKEVVITLENGLISALKEYALKASRGLANEKEYMIDDLQKYIALEAVIPFLSKDQSYKGDIIHTAAFRKEGTRLWQSSCINNHAITALDFIITNRNELGSNRNEVLESAVRKMIGIATNPFHIANPRHYDVHHTLNIDTARAKSYLIRLMEEDPTYEYIKEIRVAYDNCCGRNIVEQVIHDGFRPECFTRKFLLREGDDWIGF